MTYEGFSNQETWQVHLAITNSRVVLYNLYDLYNQNKLSQQDIKRIYLHYLRHDNPVDLKKVDWSEIEQELLIKFNEGI